MRPSEDYVTPPQNGRHTYTKTYAHITKPQTPETQHHPSQDGTPKITNNITHQGMHKIATSIISTLKPLSCTSLLEPTKPNFVDTQDSTECHSRTRSTITINRRRAKLQWDSSVMMKGSQAPDGGDSALLNRVLVETHFEVSEKHHLVRHFGASKSAFTKARLPKHDLPAHGLQALATTNFKTRHPQVREIPLRTHRVFCQGNCTVQERIYT